MLTGTDPVPAGLEGLVGSTGAFEGELALVLEALGTLTPVSIEEAVMSTFEDGTEP